MSTDAIGITRVLIGWITTIIVLCLPIGSPVALASDDDAVSRSLTGGGLTRFDVLMRKLYHLEVPVGEILASTNRDFVLDWVEVLQENPENWQEELCVIAMRLGYLDAFSSQSDRSTAQSIMEGLSSFACIPKTLVLTDLRDKGAAKLDEAISHTVVLMFYHFDRPRTVRNDSKPASSVEAVRRILKPMPPRLRVLAEAAIEKRTEIVEMVEGSHPCELIKVALDYWDGRNGRPKDRTIGELLIHRAAASFEFSDINFERVSRSLEFRRYTPSELVNETATQAKIRELQFDGLLSLSRNGDPRASRRVVAVLESRGELETVLEHYFILSASGDQGARKKARGLATKLGIDPGPVREAARKSYSVYRDNTCEAKGFN